MTTGTMTGNVTLDGVKNSFSATSVRRDINYEYDTESMALRFFGTQDTSTESICVQVAVGDQNTQGGKLILGDLKLVSVLLSSPGGGGALGGRPPIRLTSGTVELKRDDASNNIQGTIVASGIDDKKSYSVDLKFNLTGTN
ncbi:hypothetical protein [Pseudomonas sp. EL_65y_Pfl1_R83]|uniref:hypothetical protein n=1 Tax=Pseudomonas sp. EL_65y_Pfl1_R83 TaxID=3088697 RepID=UPI0030DB626F